MRIRTSLATRLLIALVIPMSAFALVLGGGGTLVTRRIVDLSADRLLAGAVRAIAETMTVENGKVWVNIPPWALGVLDNPERDRVYYSVRQSDQLLTGYGDLPEMPDVAPADEPEFRYVAYKGGVVRQASQRVVLVGAPAPVVVSVAQSLDSRRAVRAQLLDGLLVLEGLMIVLAACLVWPAVRWNLRPLDRIRQQLESRSATKLHRFEPVSLDIAPSEIRPVLEAFNQVLTRLDRASESARRFSADASHQMRTPLTVLKTHLALLESKPRRSLADREAIADAREAADRLGRLLLQLLALARADNETAVHLQVLDLAAHTRAAIETAHAMAGNAGVTLDFIAPERPVLAQAHPELLAEILSNLLDNAIRYGGAGTVTTRVFGNDRSASVEIRDQGPGIPVADRTAVFGRFTRLAASQQVAGSGLGLSIVHSLALRQNASVVLDDAEPGRGLCVVVTFAFGSTSP